jgi:sodium/potassium-transporting ATPase subunit alpha
LCFFFSDLPHGPGSSNPVTYFTKTSPDFVNDRGQTINANKQVDAFAQAQSIG